MTAQTRSIVVAAMVVTDPVGWVLCVRKRGTDTFMLPGDKSEPGESVDSPEVTAVCEVSEEFGVDVELSQLRSWSITRATATNKTSFEIVGHRVRYVGEFTDELANAQPHAEIEEVRWLNPRLPTEKVAPMLVETTLPKLHEELPRLAAGREQPQRILSPLIVFCDSDFGNDPTWRVTTERLDQTPAENRAKFVYGGAAIGLMDTVANASSDDGGSVTGIVLEILVKGGIAHLQSTHLETVTTMTDRKSRMYELGDAFVMLPGGAGTLGESFEVWTQQHLGIHTKPVALLSPPDFWEPLLVPLRNVVDVGFVRPELPNALTVVDDVDKLLPALIMWRAGRTKF